MSANNWNKCPNCAYQAQKEKDRIMEAVIATYGELPYDQWHNAYNRARQHCARIAAEESLREDWVIGTCRDTPVKFVVSYRAQCDVCGFEFEFEHESVIFEPDKEETL